MAEQPSAPLLQFEASAECAARFEHGGDGRLITSVLCLRGGRGWEQSFARNFLVVALNVV